METLGGLPPPDLPLPAAILALAGDRAIRPVWLNELGGLTCEIGTHPDRRFVKWAPAGSGIDLGAEGARLRWAADFTQVPRVLGEGAGRNGAWLVTEALPGTMAVSDRWKQEPRTAVAGIGAGLRAMHDALPVSACPFSWSAADRLADTYRRAERGQIDPSSWHPEHRHLTLQRALDVLADAPAPDRVVVCHGDACAPNTLLDDRGRCTGHVDLGELGVGDRWADLAVATWSATWNYGPGWEGPLLEAYGVHPDHDRIRYYRLLWDLGP
ncbi:MAG: aminoglycoside 3'-phosphotransferase [Streptosporangiales bacterium]